MIKYPNIRRPLLDGFGRKQRASFTMTDPRAGAPYIKYLPDNQPVIYQVIFRFKDEERIIFWSWFKFSIESGRKPFLLELLTEEGLTEHQCQFMPDSLMDMTPNTSKIFTYRATIITKKINTPIIDDLGDLTGLDELIADRSILDIAVNEKLP